MGRSIYLGLISTRHYVAAYLATRLRYHFKVATEKSGIKVLCDLKMMSREELKNVCLKEFALEKEDSSKILSVVKQNVYTSRDYHSFTSSCQTQNISNMDHVSGLNQKDASLTCLISRGLIPFLAIMLSFSYTSSCLCILGRRKNQ